MKICFPGGRTCALVICLATLRASAVAAGPAENASKLSWVQFDDPSEHALSMEVPQGWEVKGGLFRFGYFDVRWMLDLVSPDGKVVLRLDDASVPPYVPPGPHTPPAGQPFNKPQQFQMMVEDYRTGQSFAETYAQSRFKSACPGLTLQPANWKAEIPAALQQHPAKFTEGSVSGTCNAKVGPRTVFVYALTSLFRQPNATFWTVDPLISAITTPDSLPLAQAVAQHMIDTVKKNPQWVQYQNQMTQMGLQAIQRNFQQFMSQMRAYDQARSSAMNQQVAGFEARQQANQKQFESWDENFVGLTKVADPLTGEKFDVWSGPYGNYYRNGQGTVINSVNQPAGTHQVDVQH